ncbi:MAG: cold shock domain-containing protein [Oscillospiraceae bacterium]|nr:cold shock domain-containing protein [Oscillospiraceae bacterium]
MKGKIKFFNTKKGYGFITGEDGNDYFLHISDVDGFGGVYPVSGQAVEIASTETTSKGTAAKGVVLLDQ